VGGILSLHQVVRGEIIRFLMNGFLIGIRYSRLGTWSSGV
jgi:hypothetical protein